MKAKLFGCIFLVFGAFQTTSAQIAEVRTYGGPLIDEGRQIITTQTGYLIVGTTTSADNGNSDVYVLSINDDLSIEWSKLLGSSAAEQGRSVCVTEDGDYLVLGQTASGEFGGYDLVIYKLNSNGDLIWEKYFGTDDWDLAVRIVSGDGNYYIAATSFGFFPGTSRQWMFRIDGDGNFLNGNTFDIIPEAEANDIAFYDGHVYLMGTRTFEGQPSQSVFRKLLPDGTQVWQQVRSDVAHLGGAIAASDQGIVATYAFNNIEQPNSMSLRSVRYDENGVEIWSRWSDTQMVSNQFPRAVTWANDALVLAAESDVFGAGGLGCLMERRLGVNGAWTGAAVFGDSADETPYAILTDSEGRVVMVGSSDSYGNGNPDIYLVRVPNGIIVANYELDLAHFVTTDPFTHIAENQLEASFQPYPNPAGRQINLSPQTSSFVLLNIQGNTVLSGASGSAINVAHLPRGAYILQWQGTSDEVYFHRILLQ
jgi:hypothetical protein